MRRIPVAILFALAVGLMVAPAVAASTPGDRSSGFGVRAPACVPGCPSGHFAFDARSGPNGENAHGWYDIDFPGFASFVGQVSCLHVSGKWATIYGQISSGTGAADPNTYTQDQEPLYFVVVVHGLGAPYRGSPARDQMSFTGWDTEANFLAEENIALADICTNPYEALGNSTMMPLIAGDLRVIDR